MVDEYEYEITMIHDKTDSFLLKTNYPTPPPPSLFLGLLKGPKNPTHPTNVRWVADHFDRWVRFLIKYQLPLIYNISK